MRLGVSNRMGLSVPPAAPSGPAPTIDFAGPFSRSVSALPVGPAYGLQSEELRVLFTAHGVSHILNLVTGSSEVQIDQSGYLSIASDIGEGQAVGTLTLITEYGMDEAAVEINLLP